MRMLIMILKTMMITHVCISDQMYSLHHQVSLTDEHHVALWFSLGRTTMDHEDGYCTLCDNVATYTDLPPRNQIM